MHVQDITEDTVWGEPRESLVHLFVDAASTPAWLAAVLYIDGQQFFSDCAPTQEMLDCLVRRNDKQIMSLEMYAILVGIATFCHLIKGRRVVVWSDNTGAEHATRRGSCTASDQNQIIHQVWSFAYMQKIKIWIERVASEDTISDRPSRGSYDLMRHINARWCEPVLTGWEHL